MLRICFSVLLGIFLFALPSRLAADAAPAILVMEKVASNLTYTLNVKAVRRSEGILLALSRCRDADSGKDPELTVFASEALPFSSVTEVMGIAGKARYFRFRVFVFNKQKHAMYELTYSKSLPFSMTVSSAVPR